MFGSKETILSSHFGYFSVDYGILFYALPVVGRFRNELTFFQQYTELRANMLITAIKSHGVFIVRLLKNSNGMLSGSSGESEGSRRF